MCTIICNLIYCSNFLVCYNMAMNRARHLRFFILKGRLSLEIFSFKVKSASAKRWVFKDCSNRHSDLRRHENWLIGLTSAWKLVFMPA